ncbi:MAG TPA: hypothetical protein VH325_08500 [Bryobacteraceae bacterium]|nr:hypothetical protein [Bryobacteraceae bacterium]
MDSSQEIYTSSLDELRRIELDARRSNSLDHLRASFERVQMLRRLHPDDFDLQLFIAEVQDHIIERARMLREEPLIANASVLMTDNPGRLVPESHPTPKNAAPLPPEERPDVAEAPPGVERVDIKTWQRAIWIGLFFCVIVLSAFWYLIMTARRLYFTPGDAAGQAAAAQNSGKNAPVQNASSQALPPVSKKPTVRLYTDLVPGTVSIDENPPEDLKDGELQLDNLEPGRHSMKVVGQSGSAEFSFDVSDKDAPKVVGSPAASNVMAVLVSTEAGKARLVTNADASEVTLDGKSAGQVGADGLTMDDLGSTDHDLEVVQDKDHQRFILTYTPAPALTVYVKSDPNAGTVVVVAGEDNADVYINDKLYRRKTDRGQIRIPNLRVGTYVIRVHKQGFIDPPPQTVDVRKAEETRVPFRMQPVPEIATLQIKGALPGTMVYVDRDLAAAIGADGNATISNVKPGDHVIELRRDQALAKRFPRSFHTGDVVTLSGPDVTLDKVVVENKPAPASTPEPAAAPAPGDAGSNGMQIDGEQLRRGGGFVAYHVPRVPGRYEFMAQVRKGGFLKRGKLQFYAGYQDSDNYVLFTLDGKHAIIKQVKEGKSTERRTPFTSDPNDWVQVQMSVRQNAIDARVKSTGGAWEDLGAVPTAHDSTQGKVGFLIPGNDEIAVSNFRFSTH